MISQRLPALSWCIAHCRIGDVLSQETLQILWGGCSWKCTRIYGQRRFQEHHLQLRFQAVRAVYSFSLWYKKVVLSSLPCRISQKSRSLRGIYQLNLIQQHSATCCQQDGLACYIQSYQYGHSRLLSSRKSMPTFFCHYSNQRTSEELSKKA